MTQRIVPAARLDEFFAQHQPALMRHGVVVASWRWRGGRRLGPYYRIECRGDDRRKISAYLGAEGPLVAAARERLALLRSPLRERRQRSRIKRQLRRQLRGVRASLAKELAKLGLRLKGSEIRGTGGVKPSHALMAALTERSDERT